ncbi:hypothetical protein KR059_000693, partial [Drosophila kikkawai]
MRVSKEKSYFFKESVEYLGFMVSSGGITTSPSKVEAIQKYYQPTNLFSVRSTLQDRELNFATNEREFLAIVWPLKSLRNYLYGVKDLNIFTDHQPCPPLTYALSDRNPNAKIKRWKAFIDEHGAKIFYKPGKENYVADALSRQAIHVLENDPQSDIATVHSEISLTYTIETIDKPVNCFRNQIVIEEGSADSTQTFIIF